MEVSPITTGICLIHSINLLDLIPNAPLTPLTWLMVGVLLRHVKEGNVVRTETETNSPAKKRRRTVL